MGQLQIALLGGVEARLTTGRVLSLPGQTAPALLAYLGARLGQCHTRDELCALLWPDVPASQARHRLRQTLLVLRRALGSASPGWLLKSSEGITVDPDSVVVDVVAFEQTLADGSREALTRAVSLYRGDFLAGLAEQAGPFEEWLLPERERLRELALEGLGRLLGQQLETHADGEAVHTATRLLALDPAQEAVHRTLMRLYARQGRSAAALRQYQSCVAALRRDLGVEPEPETRQLYQMLLRERSEPHDGRAVREATTPGAAIAESLVAETETPLVGRQAERDELRRHRDAAWSGSGRIAIVRGEAGIGKTRLIAEIVRDVLDHDGEVVLGRAHETQQILPFGVWIDALRAAGVPDELGRETPLGPAVRRELARLFPELGSAPVPTSRDYGRLFEALGSVFVALSQRRPLLLVVEDLQWADEMTLRFLAFLSRRLRVHRALIVATVREEEVRTAPLLSAVLEELQGEGRTAVVRLGALSREHVDELVAALIPSGKPADRARLMEQLRTTSAGNPFVLVELVRAIRDGVVPSDAPALPLPERVREAIAHRLGQLGERERHVLGAATVIGREAGFRLLQRVAGLTEREVAEATEQLVARGVLHAVGDELDFVHDRVREVAYARLMPSRRVALHEASGQALEELYAGRLDEVADRLAFHFARSERADRAITYLARLADRAVLSYAHAEAIAALAEARRLVERLPAAERDRWLITLALREAFPLAFLGRFRDTLARLLPLSPRVEALDDAALAGPYFFRLGITHSYFGRQAHAVLNARRAIVEATRGGDLVTEGQAQYVLALSSYYLGVCSKGVEHAERAIALLQNRSPHWCGLAQWVLALQLGVLGEFDRALQAIRALEATAKAVEESRLQSFAASAIGIIHVGRGEMEAAVVACRRAVALVSPQDAVATALAKSRLGWALIEAGDADSAIPILEEVTQAVTGFAFRQVLGWYTVFLAEGYLVRGDLARAWALAREAHDLASLLQFRLAQAAAERTLGRVAIAAGDLAGAEQWLLTAAARYEAIPAPGELARTRLVQAEVAVSLGKLDAAGQAIRSARKTFSALPAPRWVERTDTLVGTLGLLIGDRNAPAGRVQNPTAAPDA